MRRSGTAPRLDAVEEWVGDFYDPDLAAAVVEGAIAVVTTVHPLGTDLETQHRIAVEGTPVLARAARDAGVGRLVHISTAAVYDRSPGVGDVDEASPLVADDANAYAVTKRDTDAALADVDGMTRVILRPPAILGPGESSVWNSRRPAEIRDDEAARHAVPGGSFTWVHVDGPRDPGRRRGRGSRPDSHRTRRRGQSRADAPSSTSPRARRRPATTSRRSPGLSASSRSGTRGPHGPAGSWLGAPTSGDGLPPSTCPRRSPSSRTDCARRADRSPDPSCRWSSVKKGLTSDTHNR